jgi:ABC-type dipeptide/oligopeptide/nickel transport system ATPase subunit
MNAPSARSFEAKPAVRESVPLLVGLMGPSGGGKTFSALRLATGIQKIHGGEIYGIDTEARRMLHYADRFKFRHVQFDAPFGSLDYLSAIRQCVKAGAGVVIIDSMSHEHDNVGGLLDFHDKELDRLAGDDYGKRDRMKMLAWQKPKAARQAMISGILQLNANFIFCFRAKEKLKIIAGKQPIPQGFMPIAGDELVFEMTVNCLLLPHADGVPTWRSDQVGEKMMMKLPEQFRGIFEKEQPLSEAIGEKLAAWAKGGATNSAAPSPLAAEKAGEAATSPPSTDGLPGEPSDDDLLATAREKADEGARVFNAWMRDQTFPDREKVETIKAELRQRMQAAAEAARSAP